MKKIVLILSSVFALFVFSGCTEKQRIETEVNIYVDESAKKEISDFILRCAKNANPMSDEEGEDLVYQCEKTGLRIFGKKTYSFCYTTSSFCSDEELISCDDASTPLEKKVCDGIKKSKM